MRRGLSTVARVAIPAAIALAAGVVVAACDEVYADPITTPFGATVDAGGTFSTPRAKPVQCPRSAQQNSPCSRPGAICEYGGNADPTCNMHVICTTDPYGTAWSDQARGSCPACPVDPAAIVDGAPCEVPDAGADEAEIQCPTAAGNCACTTGPDGAHAHPRRWVCVPPQGDCPATRPMLGQPCVGARTCDYGACAFKRGTQMICQDEVWQVEVATCSK